ncbi:hypothetical protein BJV77DRAFT_1010470 [Russula vinacea]|nr:hypothetical protein BJV77DRAFT_1010470 [Russula vinacea]
MSSSVSPLFQPLRLGAVNVQHRVVMAPLTRFRANKSHVHGELTKTYYDQRATVPGTLIISEATFVAPQAGGTGMRQIAGWKTGSFIFLQLWALGRVADSNVLKTEGNFDVVAPSSIPLASDRESVPRELTVTEIKEYVQLYAKAARNAIEAGFDGVEVHAANGYLLDQFLQSVSNERTDEYGGRFKIVIDAVVKAVGAERTGVRLSPWSKFQDMGMEDPLPTFTPLVERIRDAHPNFAYVHVIEDVQFINDERGTHNWGDRPYIAAGGFNRASANDMVEKHGGLIAFGRDFIANPDLPLRLKEGIALTHYNRDTFYLAKPRHSNVKPNKNHE